MDVVATTYILHAFCSPLTQKRFSSRGWVEQLPYMFASRLSGSRGDRDTINQSELLEHLHPFASERERVKMLVKTKSWSRFRERMRAEAALRDVPHDCVHHPSCQDSNPVKEIVRRHGLQRIVAAVLVAHEDHGRRHARCREGRRVMRRRTADGQHRNLDRPGRFLQRRRDAWIDDANGGRCPGAAVEADAAALL